MTLGAPADVPPPRGTGPLANVAIIAELVIRFGLPTVLTCGLLLVLLGIVPTPLIQGIAATGRRAVDDELIRNQVRGHQQMDDLLVVLRAIKDDLTRGADDRRRLIRLLDRMEITQDLLCQELARLQPKMRCFPVSLGVPGDGGR